MGAKRKPAPKREPSLREMAERMLSDAGLPNNYYVTATRDGIVRYMVRLARHAWRQGYARGMEFAARIARNEDAARAMVVPPKTGECKSCGGSLYHFAGCGLGEHGIMIAKRHRVP